MTMPRPSAIPRALRVLQSLDRGLGPALCRAVRPRAGGLAADRSGAPGPRGAPLPAEAIGRILVIRPGGLGDAALSWPLLHALRTTYPDARIDVLAERRNAGIYRLEEPDAKLRVWCYDRQPLQFLWELRGAGYDLIIDTEQYHHFSVLLANALRPRWLCGFDTLGRGRFQTHAVAHSEDTYEAVSFLALAEAVTGRRLPFDADQPFITPGAAALDWADEALRARGSRPTVTVMPAAGGAYRLWPAERYTAVARWLTGRGYHVAVIGGADGIEAARTISSGQEPALLTNLAGRTTLAQTAAVLRQSRLAISADTGVLHVAAGVGTPTVALFGPGLHRKWAPPGRNHRVVRRNLPCSPCTRLGRVPPCPINVACMTEITVGDVLAAATELLDQQPGS